VEALVGGRRRPRGEVHGEVGARRGVGGERGDPDQAPGLGVDPGPHVERVARAAGVDRHGAAGPLDRGERLIRLAPRHDGTEALLAIAECPPRLYSGLGVDRHGDAALFELGREVEHERHLHCGALRKGRDQGMLGVVDEPRMT